MLRLPAFLACLFLAGCVTVDSLSSFQPTATESHLANLVVQRMEISRQVAWLKFQNNAPVRDPKREQELLASLVRQAGKYALPPAQVQKFFRAQIDASCQVQANLIDYWSRGGRLPTYPPQDLKRDIRPALDRIGSQMLADLAALKREKPRSGLGVYAASLLRQQGFPWLATRTATSVLP